MKRINSRPFHQRQRSPDSKVVFERLVNLHSVKNKSIKSYSNSSGNSQCQNGRAGGCPAVHSDWSRENVKHKFTNDESRKLNHKSIDMSSVDMKLMKITNQITKSLEVSHRQQQHKSFEKDSGFTSSAEQIGNGDKKSLVNYISPSVSQNRTLEVDGKPSNRKEYALYWWIASNVEPL